MPFSLPIRRYVYHYVCVYKGVCIYLCMNLPVEILWLFMCDLVQSAASVAQSRASLMQ